MAHKHKPKHPSDMKPKEFIEYLSTLAEAIANGKRLEFYRDLFDGWSLSFVRQKNLWQEVIGYTILHRHKDCLVYRVRPDVPDHIEDGEQSPMSETQFRTLKESLPLAPAPAMSDEEINAVVDKAVERKLKELGLMPLALK